MSQVNAPEDNQCNRSEQTKTTTQFRVATELEVAAEKVALFPANPLVNSDQVQAISQQELLWQELEKARQVLQYQQSLVASLREQLANSQARNAQLETDLNFVQQRYQQQAHLLQETETACLDLRARLHRQQRQTLQFKAALEQCLDAASSYQSSHQGCAAVPERSPDLFSQGTDGLTAAIEETHPQNPPGSTSALAHRSSEVRSLSTWQHSDAKPQTSSASEQVSPEAGQPLRLPLVFKEQPIRPWSASAFKRRPVDAHTSEAIAGSASTRGESSPQTSETAHLDRTPPSRTSKKKTLATVELPSFPRHRC